MNTNNKHKTRKQKKVYIHKLLNCKKNKKNETKKRNGLHSDKYEDNMSFLDELNVCICRKVPTDTKTRSQQVIQYPIQIKFGEKCRGCEICCGCKECDLSYLDQTDDLYLYDNTW